jgi:NAD(P)-dependent dehydrogenase (short-subunit alcohol dehydrogenase family)
MPENDAAGDLDGRLFVVAGGTGRAGGAVVASLIKHGATVAVPSRSADRIDRLHASVDSKRLHGFVADISDLASAGALRQRVTSELGPIDGVVAALGGWWEGASLVELDLETWHKIMEDNLTSHFAVARTFLPVLADRADAVYLTLGGIASVQPEAGSGPISITGAGQAMMMRVLAAELAGRAVRLHELDVFTPVVTDHWEDGPIEPGWLTGQEVGDHVAAVLRPDFADAGLLFLSIPDGRPRVAAQAKLDDLLQQ